MLRGAFSERLQSNIAALEQAGNMLTPENRQVLDGFKAARAASLLPRLAGLRRVGPYRQSLLGNIGFWGAAVLMHLIPSHRSCLSAARGFLRACRATLSSGSCLSALSQVTVLSDINHGGYDALLDLDVRHVILPGLSTRLSLSHMWQGWRGLLNFLKKSTRIWFGYMPACPL